MGRTDTAMGACKRQRLYDKISIGPAPMAPRARASRRVLSQTTRRGSPFHHRCDVHTRMPNEANTNPDSFGDDSLSMAMPSSSSTQPWNIHNGAQTESRCPIPKSPFSQASKPMEPIAATHIASTQSCHQGVQEPAIPARNTKVSSDEGPTLLAVTPKPDLRVAADTSSSRFGGWRTAQTCSKTRRWRLQFLGTRRIPSAVAACLPTTLTRHRRHNHPRAAIPSCKGFAPCGLEGVLAAQQRSNACGLA